MFIPTKEEIAEVSPYEIEDFQEHYNNLEKWIKLHTTKVYDLMYGAYTQKVGKQDHNRTIRARIYMNKSGEKQAIIDAVHEILMGGMTGEMDLEEYDTETGKIVMPESVKNKLNRAELLERGKLFANIPEGLEKYV